MFQRIPQLLALGSTLVFLACLVVACTNSSKPASWDDMSGPQLWAAAGCSACHGQDGRGNMMNLGPSYAGVKQHWDKQRLLVYMADPATFAASVDRLGKRAMPAMPSDVTPAARERLAEYVLTLMD